MTKTTTKTKPVRDASGRFAPAKKRVGRPRKTVLGVKVPKNTFVYEDDAEELPTQPYTSPRVERNKARKAAGVQEKPSLGHWVVTALLMFAVIALSFLLGAT